VKDKEPEKDKRKPDTKRSRRDKPVKDKKPEPVKKDTPPKAEPKEKAKELKKETSKAKEESKPEPKPAPKKLQPVAALNEFDREMQSVSSQLKAEELARRQKAADAAARQEADRLAAERRAEEQRLAGQQKAREQNVQIGKFTLLIRNRVTKVWDIPANISNNSRAVVRISLLPGGEVANVLVVQSSGNKAFDESIKAAVYKSSPLPTPDDSALFNSHFRILQMEFEKED